MSTETMKDYSNRTQSLVNLMRENLSKANDLVVKDSPVDFINHEFICFIHNSITKGYLLMVQFWCEDALGLHNEEYIEIFHLLEKNLAFQNEFLQKLYSPTLGGKKYGSFSGLRPSFMVLPWMA